MRFDAFVVWLSDSDGPSPDRDPISIGLRILQILAGRLDNGAAAGPTARDLVTLRVAIEGTPDGLLRAALEGLFDTIVEARPAAPRLLVYGRGFEDDGAYPLAVEVYRLAVFLGRCEPELVRVAEALNRISVCLRRQDRLDDARTACRAAIAFAQEVGNINAELMAHVTAAKLDLYQGRFDPARVLLDWVIERARTTLSTRALAVALHDRAAIANHDGDNERALVYLGEALTLQPTTQGQLRILIDAGNALRACGWTDVARAAFEAVWHTTGHADAAYSAAINVLGVAADEERWDVFDKMRNLISTYPLSGRLACELLGTVAYGLSRRGRTAHAHCAYRRQADLARQCGFTDILDSAVRALNGESTWQPPHAARPLPSCCQPAIEAIRAWRGRMGDDQCA